MRRSLVLAAVLAGACSSHSTATPPVGTPSPTAVPKPPTATPPAAFAVTRLSGAQMFTSADGNLGCDIESAYARCDPKAHSWRVPPEPSDCSSGWGHGIELQAGTKASFFCGSDSVAGGKRVLAAGHAFLVGFVQCDAVSATTIHCHDTADAHGFTVSKARYLLS